jgi:hypothetical protein
MVAILFGQKNKIWPPTVTFSPTFFDGKNGVAITGTQTDHLLFGCSALVVGDVNNDSYPDLLVGAVSSSLSGQPGSGSIYVLWGKKKGWYTPMDTTGL